MTVAAAPSTRTRAARPAAAPAATRKPGRLDDSGLFHLVGYAASRAALELRKVFTRHMDAFGLTTPQFSILMLVFDNGDVVRPKDSMCRVNTLRSSSAARDAA